MNWKPVVKLALQVVLLALDAYCATKKVKRPKPQS
jgi:hypothetical protein